MERHLQYLRRSAWYDTVGGFQLSPFRSVLGQRLKVGIYVACYEPVVQHYAVWFLWSRPECIIVAIIVHLYRAPVYGVLQGHYILGAVLVGRRQPPVFNPALHVVGASRHQQIGIAGLPAEGDRNLVGVVVPERRVDDVPTLGRGLETAPQPGIEYIILQLRTESVVLYLMILMGDASFAHSLLGQFQGGYSRARCKILVAIDVVHVGVEIGREVHHQGILHGLGRYVIESHAADILLGGDILLGRTDVLMPDWIGQSRPAYRDACRGMMAWLYGPKGKVNHESFARLCRLARPRTLNHEP